MPEKPKFLDYEPITPPRGPLFLNPDEIEATLSARVSEPRPVSPFPDEKKDIKQDGPLRFPSVPKRGHALSFVGVFLFTLILYFRPYELSPSLAWLSSSAFWIALVTIAIFLPTQLGLEGNLTAPTREVKLVLLLTLAAFISIPFALSPATAWISFTEYLKVVMIFVVMVNVVRTEKRLKALLLATLGASCLLSLAALNDYRLGHLGLEGKRISGAIGGMFANPNDLALHLVTLAPLAIGLLFATRSILIKFLYAVCASLVVLAIVATFSRGGLLGLAATGLVLAFKLAPKLRILVATLFVALLLGSLAIAPGAFRERLFTTRDASAQSRTDDLKRSTYLAIRHPVFGIGMNNYVYYSNQGKATHNAYTQVAAEIGIAGLAFYVLFLTAPLRPLRRIERETLHEKKGRRIHYLSIGVQAAIIGYMVCSFFASVAYLWYIYYLVAYGVCLRRIYQTTHSQSADSASRTISHK